MSEIPKNAKLVYKGKLFEVYRWEQELFDGTMDTFEMLKRPDTIQIITVVGDKVLVTREEQPGRPVRELGFLGGRSEEGEEPLVTAKRELLEESGLESDDWELWKVYDPFVKMDWKIYMFIARNCRKVSEPKLDAGEKIQMREVNFDEFIELFTGEGFWAPSFSNDLLRMKLDGALPEFRKKLFP